MRFALHRILFIFFSAALSLLLGVATAASIAIQNGPSHEVLIEGVITNDDPAKLFARIDELFHRFPNDAFHFISINSPGGNVEAAIKMGAILHADSRAYITVATDQRCYSACVLVVAGTMRRNLHGQIGIHRLYSDSVEPSSYEEIRANRQAIAKAVRQFLSDVNISPTLYEAMDLIPANQLKILTQREYESFGLIETDPVLDELSSAAGARNLGITREQYNERYSRVEQICMKEPLVNDKTRTEQCIRDVMSGTRSN